MAPPATFYTVSTFPYSQLVTQADFNAGSHSGGVANEVWFKHVATPDFALTSYVTLGTFIPRIAVFESDALTLLNDESNAAFWTKITSADNYWIRVRKNPAGAATADFTVNLDSVTYAPTIVPGDYLINDDEDGFPGIIIAPNGTIRGFAATVPAGEMLVGLLTGEVLAHDRFGLHGSKMALLDADLSLIAAFDFSPTLSGFPPLAAMGTLFYALNPSNRNLYTITTAGVVTLLAPAVAAFVQAIGVSPDGTILYYADGTKTIKRYDLVGLAPLSDLYTVAGTDTLTIAITGINGHPGEILVQSDGSIVTYYQNFTASQSVLLHLSAAGSLLHSYTYPFSTALVDHIARAPDDPDFINIWYFLANSDTTGRFAHLELSSGTLNPSFDTHLFSAGIDRTSASGIPIGPSSSCGFTTLLLSSAEPPIPTDSGEGGSGTIDTCCDHPPPGTTPPEGGNVGTNPNPVGVLPPWMASCTGGGDVDNVPDLSDGELWV